MTEDMAEPGAQNPASGQSPAPDWYPDPMGRYEMRYWDGTAWTEHVSNQGKQAVDPPTGVATTVTTNTSPDQIQKQVALHDKASAKAGVQSGDQAPSGDGTLLGEQLLVVNQKAKLIEVNNEYAVFNRDGAQVGTVRQVGQSALRKVLRVVSSIDQYLSHTMQIVDASGAVIMVLTRPAKLMKSKVIVQDASGIEVGKIIQQNMMGKIRFGFMVDGQEIGGIHAENWRAWNFSIKDHTGTEVARITKTFEGLAKTLFTTADNYVLQIHQPLQDPLRQLVVASALTVDTALKQDQRGFG